MKGASTSRPGARQMQHFTGDLNHQKQNSLNDTMIELAGIHVAAQKRESHLVSSIKVTKPIISGEIPLRDEERSFHRGFNGKTTSKVPELY